MTTLVKETKVETKPVTTKAEPGCIVTPEMRLRSFTSTLTDGKAGQYRVHGSRRKDGSWTVYVKAMEMDSKGKVKASQRGATETLPDVTAARAYGDKAIAEGLKLGWVRRGAGGYSPRPDAFSLKNVPAPGALAKK
jgi:hypothetical protein